jgi:hypothetical protein
MNAFSAFNVDILGRSHDECGSRIHHLHLEEKPRLNAEYAFRLAIRRIDHLFS